MTTENNNLKRERKNNLDGNFYSKRVSWNSKRKYNYKYITSVF